MTEKRHFERVNFIERVDIQWGENTRHCQLLDISLHGALLQLPEAAQPIDPSSPAYNLSLHLAGSPIVLHFQAKAVHFHANTIGFEFTTMDCDSMAHLRRLLELNTGNPEEIDRELLHMIKQRRS